MERAPDIVGGMCNVGVWCVGVRGLSVLHTTFRGSACGGAGPI